MKNNKKKTKVVNLEYIVSVSSLRVASSLQNSLSLVQPMRQTKHWIFISSTSGSTHVHLEFFHEWWSWAIFYDNHLLSINFQFHPRIEDCIVCESFDCNWHSRNFINFPFLYLLINSGNSLAPFFIRFYYRIAKLMNFYHTHIIALAVQFQPRIYYHTLPDNFDCKWHGLNYP